LRAVQRGEAVVEEVKQHTDIRGKNILDVGCGTGGISVAFARAGAKVVGLDSGNTDPVNIKMATARAKKEKADIAFVRGDAQQLPFQDRTFDVVVCNDVIEHVARPKELAREVSRVLKPGGILYLSAPNRFSLPDIYKDDHYGLFGLVLLPRPLAEIYVTKIRKVAKRYTVGHIPTYPSLVKMFRRNGIHLNLIRSRVDELLLNPGEIEDSSYRKIGVLLRRLGLSGIAGRLLSSRMFAVNFCFIGYRE
jgi:ubiquinone/menaquinone biosynthesis C-methylase UbiE